MGKVKAGSDQIRLIAAGKALREVSDRSTVAKITVDGKLIDDPEAALRALQDAEAPVSSGDSTFDRLTARFEHGVDKLEGKLQGSTTGRTAMSFIRADPERLQRPAAVEISFTDGSTRKLDVAVTDARLTRTLQRISIVAEGLGLTPLLGIVFLGATALVAGVASLVSLATGDRELARTLGRVSAKHALLGAVAEVPVIGELVPALAISVDVANLKAMRTAPTVASIVNLRALAQGARA
ncbi:MAG: hypothetical protein IT383_03475 [Deltaproteobacteria bacterium]|nr:hypothetical protein [Deltaproteobacteria bacterium]